MKENNIGILPWSEDSDNPYQLLSAKGFEDIGCKVKRIKAKRFFPIYSSINNNDIDLLILDWVHSFYTSSSMLKTLIKLLLGEIDRKLLNKKKVKIIWNLHNLHRHDKKFQEIEQWHFRRLAKIVDGIRVFNQSSILRVQEYLDLEDSNKIFYVPHGHYKDVINSEVKIDIKQKFSIPKDAKVLLFIGSIRDGKGLLKFLKAFNQVQTECHIIIAGKPISKYYTENILILTAKTNNIHLDLKFIPDDLLFSYIIASDYILLPYEYILNSGTLLLALSFGKPILGNQLELFKEMIADSPHILGDLFDASCLKKCLVKIVGGFGEKRSIELSKKYNWDNIAKEMLSFGQSFYHNNDRYQK